MKHGFTNGSRRWSGIVLSGVAGEEAMIIGGITQTIKGQRYLAALRYRYAAEALSPEILLTEPDSTTGGKVS